MKELIVFYYDFYPEAFLDSLNSYRCRLDIQNLKDVDLGSLDLDFTCDLVLVILPKYGIHDYEDLFKYLEARFKGRTFVIDHCYQQRNKMLSMYYGADLYFSLPMSVADFYKYVSYYSFSSSCSDEIIEYKDLKMDSSRRVVLRAGNEINLRNREFELLKYLLRNPGIVLSKQRILEEVWDMNADTNTTTVESHMSTLRKKVDGKYEQKYIQTVYCVGYKVE